MQNARKVEMLFQVKYSLYTNYKCIGHHFMQLKLPTWPTLGIWMATFNPEKSILWYYKHFMVINDYQLIKSSTKFKCRWSFYNVKSEKSVRLQPYILWYRHVFVRLGAHNWSSKNLCMRQRASWTYPPQLFTSVHLFNKIVRSRLTISSPLFQNNWVKIHQRENKIRWRFTKLIHLF